MSGTGHSLDFARKEGQVDAAGCATIKDAAIERAGSEGLIGQKSRYQLLQMHSISEPNAGDGARARGAVGNGRPYRERFVCKTAMSDHQKSAGPAKISQLCQLRYLGDHLAATARR